MAKTSNLREFQESILAKLQNASEQGVGESASRLGVVVGGRRFLLSLNDVKEVLPVPHILRVPLTKPWFLGTANVRGNLYNVSDLAQFLEMPPTHKSVNNRILLLSTETTTQVALLVDSLIGLRNVQDMQSALPDAEGRRMFASRQLTDAEQNVWLELGTEALVQDKNFIQPV